MRKIYCLLFLLSINIYSQWVNINTNISTNINNISFSNYNSGYAAAFRVNDSTGILYKTINAGINWYEIEFLPGPVRKVYIPTTNEIFFVNKSHVWFSTNEGNSWIDRYFLGYDLYDIRFQNSTTMYVCGFNQSNLR